MEVLTRCVGIRSGGGHVSSSVSPTAQNCHQYSGDEYQSIDDQQQPDMSSRTLYLGQSVLDLVAYQQ